MLGLATMIASASATVPRQTTNDEESLKSALDAVTRKQRSLDFQPQNYYKYRNAGDNEVGDEFGREHGRRLEDDEENLEFLPLAGNYAIYFRHAYWTVKKHVCQILIEIYKTMLLERIKS